MELSGLIEQSHYCPTCESQTWHITHTGNAAETFQLGDLAVMSPLIRDEMETRLCQPTTYLGSESFCLGSLA